MCSCELYNGLSQSLDFDLIFTVKVGIPEFLSGIGGGVETHIAKLETEIGDLSKLLVTRTLRLKKCGVPCKHVSTIKPSVLLS